MSVDTSFEGRPGALESIATWLRSTYASGAEDLTTSVLRRRRRIEDVWEGEGEQAFHKRATELAHSSDGVDETARGTATTIEVLAGAMRTAKNGLATVRENARGAGLVVSGDTVQEPTAVAHPGTEPAPDVDAATMNAYNNRVTAWNAYQDKVTAYNTASSDTNEYLEGWREALDSAAAKLSKDDANLVTLTGNLIVDGGGGAIAARMATWYADAAKTARDTAGRAAQHLDELVKDGRLAGDKGTFYKYLDDKAKALQHLDDMEAKGTAPKLPKGVKIGGGIIGALAMGYGIKSDIEDGESTTQAVVSNAGGTAVGIGASIAAAAGAGAAVGALGGSVVPGLGTAVGAVAGVIVGTGVGIVTSGAIDSMFEKGVDSIGDVGEAIGDGWNDLTNTAGGLWDAGGDLIDGIF